MYLNTYLLDRAQGFHEVEILAPNKLIGLRWDGSLKTLDLLREKSDGRFKGFIGKNFYLKASYRLNGETPVAFNIYFSEWIVFEYKFEELGRMHIIPFQQFITNYACKVKEDAT